MKLPAFCARCQKYAGWFFEPPRNADTEAPMFWIVSGAVCNVPECDSPLIAVLGRPDHMREDTDTCSALALRVWSGKDAVDE